MDILSRLFFKLFNAITSNRNEVKTTNNNNDLNNNNNNNNITTTTIEDALSQNDDAPMAPVNLMNKIFRFQSSQTEPPEFPYENEAWSPDDGYVRLFHKGNHRREDKDSTYSHP